MLSQLLRVHRNLLYAFISTLDTWGKASGDFVTGALGIRGIIYLFILLISLHKEEKEI